MIEYIILSKSVIVMVEVVAALIWDNDKFMICQRPEHKARGLLWEFVGGKVEAGETDNLQHGWCKQICWDRPSYPENKALIEKGAIPIDENWDGAVDCLENPTPNTAEQLSMFD